MMRGEAPAKRAAKTWPYVRVGAATGYRSWQPVRGGGWIMHIGAFSCMVSDLSEPTVPKHHVCWYVGTKALTHAVFPSRGDAFLAALPLLREMLAAVVDKASDVDLLKGAPKDG